MTRRIIDTPDAPNSRTRGTPLFSQAVVAAGLVFVAGTSPLDPEGRVVGETIGEQTAQALRNISTVLAAAGSSLEKVVSATVILRDAADFAGLNEEWRKWFPVDPPARQGAKHHLDRPDVRVSIAVIAEA